MTNTDVKTIRILGIPLFSYTTHSVGPTTKELVERLAPAMLESIGEKITPEILEALKEEQSLVDAVGEKIAVTLRQEIATALGGANVK